MLNVSWRLSSCYRLCSEGRHSFTSSSRIPFPLSQPGGADAKPVYWWIPHALQQAAHGQDFQPKHKPPILHTAGVCSPYRMHSEMLCFAVTVNHVMVKCTWAGLYKYAGNWTCPIYLWEWATHCTWAPGCASGFEIERTKRIVHIKEGEIRETGEGRNSIKQAKSNPYCSAVSDLTMVLENQFLSEKTL